MIAAMADPGARTETLHSSPKAEVASALAPGQRLGRFVIEQTLGAGGMGIVVEARDPDLDRTVAIKVLHAGTRDRARQERLIREARALARIAHPNVVTVHEVGEHDGQMFIVMERIDGPSLRAWLAEAPRTVEATLDILAGAARGLAEAHAHGITHRDFKPENVMIDGDGRARVVDFGIAELGAELRGAGDGHLEVTQSRDAVGTPAYMAPEQLRGEALDAACDQFGWCVTLYEALVGERPRRRPELAQIAAGAAPEPIAIPPSGRAGKLPVRVRAVLARGLAGRPAERFPSMQALLAALAPPPRRWPFAVVGGAVAVGAALGAVALATRGASGGASSACGDGDVRLASMWSPATAEQLGASLGPYGARVVAAVDARAQAWRASFASVCRDAPAGALRDHRLACLDDAMTSMRAFVEFWSLREPGLDRSRATSGAVSLADPAACETSAPVAGVAPRSEAEEDLWARLEQATVARSAAALDRAHEIARAVADDARAIGSDRLYAKARIISGDALSFLHRFDEAERALRDAVDASARARDDQLTANAWGALIVHLGVNAGRAKEALSLATAARAAVTRLGGDHAAQVRLHLDLGRVLVSADDYAHARDELQQALALLEKPPRQPDKLVAEVHFELADALRSLGEPTAALPHFERALELQRRVYGDAHPAVGLTTELLGVTRGDLGETEAALALLERARAIFTATVGTEHPLYAANEADIGAVLGALGRYEEALPSFERQAEVMARVYGATHPLAVDMRTNYGTMLMRAKQPQRAIAVFEPLAAAPDADDPRLLVNLGLSYVEVGRAADGERACRRGEAAIPSDDASSRVVALGCIGTALARQGKRAAAREVLARARALAATLPPDVGAELDKQLAEAGVK